MPGYPVRIQRKRTKGWKMPPNTIYVGRPSKWGNPYKTGDKACDARCYRKELEWYLDKNSVISKKHEQILAGLKKLKGKNLACWCPLDSPCHADILLEIANRG
ncbi:MAG TPA: DUF4326 domain-containing protein [candidate division Zixibacteria bacterium]|nr:DUF4326 domain-containing protein [candidate division Zixibacteria bacterium]